MFRAEGRKDFHELVNQHQLMNKITTHAIEKEIFTAESVSKTGADGKPVRDRAKAAQAVADLFARRPKGVKGFVGDYVRQKEYEARVALGMPLSEGEAEAPDPAANGASREPGEDG